MQCADRSRCRTCWEPGECEGEVCDVVRHPVFCCMGVTCRENCRGKLIERQRSRFRVK